MPNPVTFVRKADTEKRAALHGLPSGTKYAKNGVNH